MALDRRTQGLRDALPPSAAWEAWLDASGERAPDFSRLAARTRLWSPAAGLDGAAGWPARRSAIQSRWRRWVIGSMPPAPPGADVRARKGGPGEVALDVLPAGGGRLRASLLLPPGRSGPLPVLMVGGSHRPWAEAARARGWAACVVRADDAGDDADTFAAAHPGHDFSRLARRAWALSRALDALGTRPEVDPRRVVLAGHSRNGKAALIAAAHDQRFAGVVSSSSGVLGAIPARLFCDRHFGEGIELLTRHYPDWFHPRLRFFAGREHRLPTDAHELLALIAPRPLLLSVAVNDPVESVRAAHETVAAVRDVYARLGAEDALALALRPGGHGADAATVAAHLDWAQGAPAGVRATPPAERWARWPRTTAPRPGEPARRPAALRREIARALGEAPRAADAPGERPLAAVRAGLGGDAAGLAIERTHTAGGLAVDVLRAHGGPAPVLLWLAPLCRATGWLPGYEQAVPLPVILARRGWAVACHDPAGTGARVSDRHGGSPLARMVADAAEVLETLAPDGAWAAGYGTGALVGLHLAALAPAIAGVAAVAPTTDEPLLARAPRYGLADLLAAVDPRPCLVVAPRWDPDAAPGAVLAAARAAGVGHRGVPDYHRLSAATRAHVADWLGAASAAPSAMAA